MRMVAALVMGAAIRPRPVGVKMHHGHSQMRNRASWMVGLNSGLPEFSNFVVQVGNSRLEWTRPQICNCRSGNPWIPGSLAQRRIDALTSILTRVRAFRRANRRVWE